MYALQKKFGKAKEMFHKDFDLLNQRGEEVSIDMASALNNYGFIQLRAGRYPDALTSFSKALPL